MNRPGYLSSKTPAYGFWGVVLNSKRKRRKQLVELSIVRNFLSYA